MAASSPSSAPSTSSTGSGPLKNIYHKRLVAETSAKPCFICYKPSSTVLITPDSRDFFYVCAGHLSDRGFATPVSQDGTPAPVPPKRDDAELQREIEKVKEEYEAKVKAKAKKKKQKEKSKKKVKDDDDDIPARKDKEDDASSEDEAAATKKRDEKIAELEKQKSTAVADKSDEVKKKADADAGPRVFALHKSFFGMRMSKIQNAAAAKRTQERMRNPTIFPSVPKGL